MNRSILAAMITLDLRGFTYEDSKLDRELLNPCLTPEASVSHLGSIYCTPVTQESALRQEAKGMMKRLEALSDEQAKAAFPAVVGRFLTRLKLLQLQGRIHAAA